METPHLDLKSSPAGQAAREQTPRLVCNFSITPSVYETEKLWKGSYIRMNKPFVFILCLILLLTAVPALAQSPGNLNNGAFVEADGDDLFIALQSGIVRLQADGISAQISTDRASMLQLVGGRLYYLAENWGTDEYGDLRKLGETPVSCLPDGSDRRVLGEERKLGEVYDFGDDDSTRNIDMLIGYRCFTVAQDAIYFLGNTNEGGTYTCYGTYEDEDGQEEISAVAGNYQNGIALFCMDINGQNLRALTGVLGNDCAQLALDGNRLYLATGYQDTVFAYDYVNYTIMDVDGHVLSVFERNELGRENLYSDVGKFYHISNAVLPFGDSMLVSLADSEGDFIATRLTRVDANGTETQLALEQYYTPSILLDTTLYYVGSSSENNFYDDSPEYLASLGIYRKDLNEAGLGVRLVALPNTSFLYDFSMCVLGDYVYYRGATGDIYRTPVVGGESFVYTENGFVNAASVEKTIG